METDARARALQVAGRALATRGRSVAELRGRLMKIAPADVVDEVVAALERVGYLDDAALAAALAERRLVQGHGLLRIEADLERLAVGRDAARAALAAAAAGERAAARALLAAKAAHTDARRRAGLLARRGFSPDAIEDALAPLEPG